MVRSRILLVDDLRTNLRILAETLKPLDAELVEASSGEEALASIAAVQFDLVILDVHLPDMTGFEVARALREGMAQTTLPLIFISTESLTAMDVSTGYDLGCIDYLCRPVIPEVLRAKARILCDLGRDRTRIAVQLEDLKRQKHELQRALAARKESERRYHAVVSQCPLAILVELDGIVVFHNPAARRLLGMDAAQYDRSFRLLQYIAPLDHAFIQGVIAQSPAQTAAIHGHELRIQREDGTLTETALFLDAVVYDGCPARQFMLQDISALKRNHVALLRVEAALEGARDAVVITDADGMPIFINIAFGNLFGFTLETLSMKGLGRIYARPAVASNHLRRVLEGEEFDQEVRLVTMKGKTIDALFRGSVVMDDLYQVVGATFVYSDITDRKRLEKELRALSREDALTGVANRRAHDRTLMIEWRRALRNQHPLSVLLLDVDNFKAYNDHFGHPAGDQCLREVARTLQASCRRPADAVARYGGEEFIVIFPETDAPEAAAVAEQIRAAIEGLAMPHVQPGTASFVTVSIGVSAVVPHEGITIADLMRMADEALYAAKRGGRNQVVVGAYSATGYLAP